MTLGEKLKSARRNTGLSQEQFAEKLCVSRSAVAKWETDGGMPDVSNLKAAAEALDVSVDFLLDSKSGNAGTERSENVRDIFRTTYDELIGKKCDIETSDFNDCAADIIVVDQDDDFLFYLSGRKLDKAGAFSKRYIIDVVNIKEPKQKKRLSAAKTINKSYFVGRRATIYTAKKEGIVKGFMDSFDDDLIDVAIAEFTDDALSLKYGKSIAVEKIVNIEEWQA